MERHFIAMRKAIALALLVFAMLTVVYGFLDYLWIPAIKGDERLILYGFGFGVIEFYFFWSYWHDTRNDIALDKKLESLMEHRSSQK